MSKDMSKIIEVYKESKDILKEAEQMRYYNAYFENVETLIKLDIAVNVAIKSMSKQIPFKLKNEDEETLTGICKCGRVTAKVEGEFYCKYCGQRVFW